MKNFTAILLFLLITYTGFAQKVNLLQLSGKEQTLTNFEVLPDDGYSLMRVIKDNHLPFRETDTLQGALAYWVKVVVINPSPTTAFLELKAKPNYETTLYRHHQTGSYWLAKTSRFDHAASPWQLGKFNYDVAANTTDTLYLYINVNAPNVLVSKFKAALILTPVYVVQARDASTFTSLIVGLAILVLFSLNNLYIYLSFKDKTVAYYLIIQLGGMIYLTGYCHYFDKLLPSWVSTYVLEHDLRFYNTDLLSLHIAIVVIFYGLIKLCRSYFNTNVTLPVYDKALKYAFIGYFILTLVLIFINLTFFNIDYYTVGADNFICLLIILLVLATSIKAYTQKLPAAGTFLLANILPLLAVCILPIYHLFGDRHNHFIYWLPVVAICAQALGYSVALVSHIKTMRDALAIKEMESRQLEFDLKEVVYKNKLSENEIKHANAEIKAKVQQNETLNEQLEGTQRELATSTLFMVKKNELLAHLKAQLSQLKTNSPYYTPKNLNEMLALLENDNKVDSSWNTFKVHFDQVHPSFFDDLKKQHPTLTQKETRLYTYFKMQLSHKEIAALLVIDQASVRRAKTRLLKKMNQPNIAE